MSLLLPSRRLLLGESGFAHSLQQGLVAYWPLDEASGTRRDLSGNGLTLTDNNGVTSNPGPSSKLPLAGQFTAPNKYLSIADTPLLKMGVQQMAFCVWMRLDTKTADRWIVDKYPAVFDVNTASWACRYVQAVDGVRFSWTDSAPAAQSVTSTSFGPIPTGAWLFVHFWFDRGTGYIQINGGPIDSVTAGTNTIQTGGVGIPLLIGANNGLTGFQDGRMAGATLWKNRVLSLSERAYLYNNGSGRALIPGRGFV